MKKLLATDLDGTLLKDNKLTMENENAVKKLIKSKNLLVISTGRPYNGVNNLIQENNINADYYILLNGALILDGLGNSINQRIIEKDIIKDILDYVIEENFYISVESGFFTYMLTEGVEIPYYNKKSANSINEISEEISLISLYNPSMDINKIENIKNNINKKYGDYIIAYRNDIYIDIVPVGCSKGNALKALVDKENIIEENVYAIGDSWNDISMFEVVKNSFTFHHVEDELKKYATYLVSSVSECINKFILKN